MIYRNGKAVESFMRNGKMASMIMKAGKIVWQAIRTNFFTKDGFYIITKDEKIFNTKE